MSNFLKKLFCKSSINVKNNDSVFSTLKELEEYDRRSWKQIIESLNRPRKKSDFVIQAERKLGLNLSEYY